jgi:hypothetical protein
MPTPGPSARRLSAGENWRDLARSDFALRKGWAVLRFGFPSQYVLSRAITGVAKYGPGAVETVVWICTASSIFIADLVLQLQELIGNRPVPAKGPRSGHSIELPPELQVADSEVAGCLIFCGFALGRVGRASLRFPKMVRAAAPKQYPLSKIYLLTILPSSATLPYEIGFPVYPPWRVYAAHGACSDQFPQAPALHLPPSGS